MHFGVVCVSNFFSTLVHTVGVVPNSLQDIGQASDGAKRRPVAGGLPELWDGDVTFKIIKLSMLQGNWNEQQG